VLTILVVAWDASRPVPWKRLVKEWAIYAGIMAVVFALFFRNGILGILAGLLVSGPLYLAFGYVLAKFGYSRKTLAELRTPRASPDTGAAASDVRSAPAPTRRTSGGGNRRPSTGSGKRKR